MHGWMLRELGLSSNELLIYSIIYGFSQDGCSEFTGSLNYLVDFTNSSRPTVLKCLKSLTDKGLLIKTDRLISNQNLPTYRVFDLDFTPSKETLPPSKEMIPPPSKVSLPNNNTINNNIDNSSEADQNSYKSKLFTKWSKEELLQSIKDAAEKRRQEKDKPSFNNKMLNEFYNYWIAPHKSGKMFFATQDKWATMQRLVTWQSYENKGK